MKADKIVSNATEQILIGFKLGGVSEAANRLRSYEAFREAIRENLNGKIPMIYLERIFYRRSK